jgi:hypothetical protein
MNGRIIPVEVKSGENTQAKSLKNYIKNYSPEVAIRLSTKPFKKDTGKTDRIDLPIYAACNIKEHI